MNDFEIEGAGIVQGTEPEVNEQEQALMVQRSEEEQEAKAEQLKALLVIPEVININGVEVSTDLLAAKIAEVKALPIPAVTDLKLIKQLETEKSRFVKLRTGSEKWRKATVKPAADWQSDLKKTTDGFGAQCKTAEDLIDAKLKPAADEKIRLANIAAAEKEKETKGRKQELIDNGAVYDPLNGTYNFPFDTNLFFNDEQIPDFTVEEWTAEIEGVTASFATETARLQQIEDDKLKRENELTGKENELTLAEANLNAKRTALRKKELRLEGYTESPDGSWSNGINSVSNKAILEVTDEQWDMAMSGEVDDQNISLAQEQEFNDGVVPGTYTSPSSLASDFLTEDGDEDFNPEDEPFEPEGIEEAQIDTTESVLTRAFVFSLSKPHIEFTIGPTFKQRIFPNEYLNTALADVQTDLIAAHGSINETLMFALIKVV